MIEKGRHFGIKREFRDCPYCDGCVEDEYHFMLLCPLYSNIRCKYIPNTYNRYRWPSGSGVRLRIGRSKVRAPRGALIEG
jgi:hypothetical protein